ncbi:MAG: membrane protein insertase YidC [Elusimicrobiota bacterium]
MNRNMILAILLSSAIYIVWFAFVSPPKKINTQQENAQQTTATSHAKSVPDTSSHQASLPQIDSSKANKAAAQPIIFKTEKADFLVDPTNASISDIVYRGPVSDVKMSLDPQVSFLNAMDGLDWKIISKNENSISFYATLSKEIAVRKTFLFPYEPGINTMALEFKNLSPKKFHIPSFPVTIGPGLGTVDSELKENPKICEGDYIYPEAGKKHPTRAKIKDSSDRGDWLWAGLNNRYFLFALINEGGLKNLKNEKKKLGENSYPYIEAYVSDFELAPGETKKISIPFYGGAKDYKLLKKLGKGLDRSVDFGFFSPLAKLADDALHFFYSKTSNYGTAIILLSILIQLMIFPLSMKSYKAMAAMKKLQPEMQALQQKYKDDPKRMNVELMELYKKHDANPLSGCWPMLLQLPIFFALFTALRNSWNLHGAHFALWIKDLSAKDPYYVLPLLMGGLMFLQQHLNPQTGGDPTQNKIMKWMPVLFTFMFLSFPSGLVIYWIINSLFSLGQTIYMKKAEQKN